MLSTTCYKSTIFKYKIDNNRDNKDNKDNWRIIKKGNKVCEKKL